MRFHLSWEVSKHRSTTSIKHFSRAACNVSQTAAPPVPLRSGMGPEFRSVVTTVHRMVGFGPSPWSIISKLLVKGWAFSTPDPLGLGLGPTRGPVGSVIALYKI